MLTSVCISKVKYNSFPVICSNCGNKRTANITATPEEINAKKTDSRIKPRIRLILFAPISLRIPASLILEEAFAVARFMKLMQASMMMRIPINVKILTYSILPPAIFPFSYWLYKYLSEYF